jgi:23S rRNA (adenine2503-C2)-methyltransferase
MKEALYGKTKQELKIIVEENNLPEFTTNQLCDWLYKKHINTIAGMTNLSKKTREILSNKYDVGLKKPVTVSVSVDGTKKYLFQTTGNNFIETAYIPEKNRATVCVSSQVGCKMNCLFCSTGKQGFQANLTSNEILNQYQSLPDFDKITNIVYMGMGEPLDNIDEVIKSLDILTSDYGYAMSPKRITVSTIGILSQLPRFLAETKVHLAVSLHTPFDNEREQIMPVQKAYKLKDVLDLIRSFDFNRQRRVSFEYIVFKNFNDSKKHAAELVKMLNGIRCRVNLIRYHKVPGVELETTDEQKLLDFQKYLKSKGIVATIRASRGQDIDAACGLLSTKAKML